MQCFDGSVNVKFFVAKKKGKEYDVKLWGLVLSAGLMVWKRWFANFKVARKNTKKFAEIRSDSQDSRFHPLTRAFQLFGVT